LLPQPQARLRAADAASLGRLREVMARYRRGEYVPEAELEAAFRALDDVPL
jgi:protein-L-isoaspartate O-methyltransferase